MSNPALEKDFELSRQKPFTFRNYDTDTEWDSAIDGDTLILRFQETLSSTDWVDNFSTMKKPYRGMKDSFRVHSGFIRKYKSIRGDLFREIERLKGQFSIIRILGYSQGGALSILVHEDIWYNLPEYRESVYTTVFGCPRVVSWGAPKERWKNVIRIENGNDVVTKVPFRWMLFSHVGNRLLIGAEKRWWKLSIRDHFPKSYKESME